MLMMVDDDRSILQPGRSHQKGWCAFPYTLVVGRSPGAVESHAQTLPEIIEEMLVSTTSERRGVMIDRDARRWSFKNVRGISRSRHEQFILAQQIANEGGASKPDDCPTTQKPAAFFNLWQR